MCQPSHPPSARSLSSIPFAPLFPSTPLKHRNQIRRIRGLRLRHIPVLHDTRTIHTIDVRERDRLGLFVNSHVDETNVVVYVAGFDQQCESGDGGIGMGGLGMEWDGDGDGRKREVRRE